MTLDSCPVRSVTQASERPIARAMVMKVARKAGLGSASGWRSSHLASSLLI